MNFSWPRLIIQCNYSGLILFIGMIIIILTNRFFSKRLSGLFIATACFGFLLMVSDNLRYFTAQQPSPDFWRYASAATGYALRPLILYFITIIAGRYFKEKQLLMKIPFLINGIFSYLSCFGPLYGTMFWFDEANVIHHGVLMFLPYFVSVFYAIAILYYSIKIVNVNGRETVIVVVFMIFGVIATYMEAVKKYDLILSQTIGLGIAFYYMFLNIQMYKRDSLTQLLKRRCFYLDMKHYGKRNFVVLSMDLNDLKYYNDTFGHQQGDEALKAVALVMQKTFKRNAYLYRTGGDEFMAIFKKLSKEQVKKLVEEFQKNLIKVEKQVACGIAVHKPGDVLETVVQSADKEMYKNKKLLKTQKQK